MREARFCVSAVSHSRIRSWLLLARLPTACSGPKDEHRFLAEQDWTQQDPGRSCVAVASQRWVEGSQSLGARYSVERGRVRKESSGRCS